MQSIAASRAALLSDSAFRQTGYELSICSADSQVPLPLLGQLDATVEDPLGPAKHCTTSKSKQLFSKYPGMGVNQLNNGLKHIMHRLEDAFYYEGYGFDLSVDVANWVVLKKKERDFIAHVLAFFLATDMTMYLNEVDRFNREAQLPIAESLYHYQMTDKEYHYDFYNRMMRTFVESFDERESLDRAIRKMPCIEKKVNFAQKWLLDRQAAFGQRAVGFAAVEGIFSAGSFAAIFWLKKQGVMPGLTSYIELFSRTQARHCELACLMYRHVINRPSHEQVRSIISDAVHIEHEFMTDGLSLRQIGLEREFVNKYVCFVADNLLVELGCTKIFNAANPFHAMKHD